MDLTVNIETRQAHISQLCLSVCTSLYLYGRCPCYPREAEESMDLTVNIETRQAKISQLSQETIPTILDDIYFQSCNLDPNPQTDGSAGDSDSIIIRNATQDLNMVK